MISLHSPSNQLGSDNQLPSSSECMDNEQTKGAVNIDNIDMLLPDS